MADNHNASGGRSTMDGMITSAIECISRLREMQPAVTNPGVIATNQNAEQPSVASEIVRLFPTFASSRSSTTGTRSNESASDRNSPSSGQGSSVRSHEVRRRVTSNQRRPVNNPSRSRSSSNNKKKKRSKIVHKDIIFICNPAVTKVPTHKKRLRLESKGRVIHDFAFDRDWEEYRLRSAIEEEMPMLMNGEYEFLKASYGSLVRPNLSSHSSLTCDSLMRIIGQGAVYVRTLEQLSQDENSDEETSSLVGNATLPSLWAETTSDSPRLNAGVHEQSDMRVDNSPETPVNQVDENITDELFNSDTQELPEVFPVVDLTAHPCVREIVIPRSNVLKSMISEFSATDILQCNLIFVFMGDQGSPEIGRGAGVTREVLSLFWKEFSVALAIGASEKVPSIRHDYQKSEWLSVARIIVFGFKEENYFPLFLSRAFIASCLYGEETLTKECLLDSFSCYVSKDEQETVKKCIQGEINPEDDDVLDLLSSYKCYRKPSKENIEVILEELAHQELVQKPRYIANAWSVEMESLKTYPEFHDFNSTSGMYAEKKPSSKRIIKLLNVEPNSDSERACFDHLKRYIKSLDDNMLAGFLQFITGSDIITVERIQVAFNANEGITRGIVAHTCGPVLELSSTYQTYNELSEELSNTLRNSFAWSFVIV